MDSYASFPSLTAIWKGVQPSLFLSSRQVVLYCTRVCEKEVNWIFRDCCMHIMKTDLRLLAGIKSGRQTYRQAGVLQASRESHRQAGSHTDKQGVTQTSRESHRQGGSHTDKQGVTQTSRESYRQAGSHTNKQGVTQTSRESHRQAGSHTDKQGVTQTSRESHRQAGSHTDKHGVIQTDMQIATSSMLRSLARAARWCAVFLARSLSL